MGLLGDQDHVSKKTPLAVNDMTVSTDIIASGTETIAFYYSNAGARTVDAGQAAGTAVQFATDKAPIYNASGTQVGDHNDTSFAFGATDTFDTEKMMTQTDKNILERDDISWATKLSTITSGLANGEYKIDYATGAGYGVKKDGDSSETATYLTRGFQVVTVTTGGSGGTSLIDDAAFGVATSAVTPAGFLADETTPDSVNEGDVGAARMTLNRRQIMAGMTLDDAAFGIGTEYVQAIGNLVDDTAPDSVDEGDIGLPRMSADRIPYVQGALAHSAVDAGNPLKIGGYANSSQRTAVAAADRVDASFNLNGEQVIASHTWATNSNRTEEIDPLSSHHVEETLANVTNETDATNYYYFDMDGFRYFSLDANTGGTAPTSTLTVTIEATNQDDGTAQASCFYTDVTQDWFGVASVVDADFRWERDTPVMAKYIRVKTVTAGGGNDQDYALYLKKAW